jgi:hypothetical protein
MAEEVGVKKGLKNPFQEHMVGILVVFHVSPGGVYLMNTLKK